MDAEVIMRPIAEVDDFALSVAKELILGPSTNG
jgi:hypothetical protein